MRLLRTLTVLFSSALLVLAEAANMSGAWTLNVKRSEWGKKPSPTRVDLVIEHSEPVLKYSGTAQAPDERGPSSFEFSGAIDQKEYPVKEDNSSRKVRFRRTSDSTIEGVYLGPDGKTQETTKTTLSRDGKTMIREVSIKLPDGRTSSWKEVYERTR